MPEDLTREELLRLYKSDIEEDVTERIEKRLIKRYSIAALVAVSLISAISGGFYAFASMLVERQVGILVEKEFQERKDQIAALTREQRDQIDVLTREQRDIANKRALAEVTLDVATNAAAKANLKLGELETARAELEQQLQGLDSKLGDFEKSVQSANDNFNKVSDAINKQIEQQREQAISLKTELADRSDLIIPLKESLVGLAQLSEQVQSLAETVQRLVNISEDRPAAVEADALSKLTESVGKIATQSAKAYQIAQRPRQTVFFQFSGDVTREQAKEISSSLTNLGYAIPGEERAPSDSRVVRYFYAEDADLARQLASDTAKVLASLGWPDLSVEPVSMADWPKAKPPQGTVELWLPLPRRGA